MSDDIRHGRPGPDLSERIAQGIGCRILAGAYPPGTALPTEHALCADLKVSRPALREGIRLLAARGLIAGRKRRGTLARPPSEWNMLDPALLSWHLEAAPSEEFVTGLFETRHIVEPAAAALAARRGGPACFARIAAALDDMTRFQDGSGDVVAADLRFHTAILAAAGNRFLASFGAVIGSSLLASFRLSWEAHARAPETSLAQHREVLEAISRRDADGARAAMVRLLEATMDDVRQALLRRRDAVPARSAARP